MSPCKREEDKIENFIFYHYNRKVKEMPIGGNLCAMAVVSKIYLDYSIENKLYGLSVN